MKNIKVIGKHSIARRIGRYFLIMIGFASLISAISLSIMWSNQSDAGMINVAGSLRMQSYRFIYEMEQHSNDIPAKLDEYQRSLDALYQHNLTHQWLLPQRVFFHYQNIRQSWQQLEQLIKNGDNLGYIAKVDGYVQQVNHFVSALQQFAELKVKIAILVIAISLFGSIALAYIGVWYTRRHIVGHLDRLVTASLQIQAEDFNHVALPVTEPNELGFLSAIFTQMANELGKLYASLEEKVEDKTRRLMAVNRSLVVLYHSSQQLTNKPLNKNSLLQVLQNVFDNEQLRAIELQVKGADYWNITIDNAPEQAWQALEITIENENLACLRWKPSLLCPDLRLIQSVSEMIGRSLYIMQGQKQQQQLVLMEERAIIARELHDSLAQSLTFLKIQVSLLKRQVGQDIQKQQSIIADLETALNDAYRQLRELLSTFRLTIQEANLNQALKQVLTNLKPQTSANIHLHCKLPSHMLNAQQQVHLLQIVREAVINSIKHANASQIDVIAEINAEGEPYVIIRDNGVGIASEIEPEGHYGLNIMKERTTELKGVFSITNHAAGGTEVQVLLPNLIVK